MYKKAQVWIARGLENEEKQVLLFKLIAKRGGGWHPITGGIDQGEEIFEGAIRETVEETGIDLNSFRCHWFDLKFSYQFKGQWGDAEEHAFGLWIESSVKKDEVALQLDPKEHTEAKWVSVKEALEATSYPGQKKPLELFYDKLRSAKKLSPC